MNDLIKQMQGNWTALAGLNVQEEECLRVNWKWVILRDSSEWDENRCTLPINLSDEYHDDVVFRISPDYKPEPVTRWFFDTEPSELEVTSWTNGKMTRLEYNGHKKHEYQYLDLDDLSSTDIEVQERDLPYLEKPEVTDEMKERGEDWVFKVAKDGDTHITCQLQGDDSSRHGIEIIAPPNKTLSFNRWVKVCTKPEATQKEKKRFIRKMLSEIQELVRELQ